MPPPRYVYIPSFISFSKKATSSNITKHNTNQNNWTFLNKQSKRLYNLIKASPNLCEKNTPPKTRFFFYFRTKKSTLSSNKLPRRGSEFFKRPKENMGPPTRLDETIPKRHGWDWTVSERVDLEYIVQRCWLLCGEENPEAAFFC